MKILSDIIMVVVVFVTSTYFAISGTFDALRSMADAMESVIDDDTDGVLSFSLTFRGSGETYVVDAEKFTFVTTGRFEERLGHSSGVCRTDTVEYAAEEGEYNNAIQLDYGKVWVLSHARPATLATRDTRGNVATERPVVIVSEIDAAEVFSTVLWQVLWVVCVVTIAHWVTSAFAAKAEKHDREFWLLHALLRWVGLFPDGALLRVSHKTKRVLEANKAAGRLLGYEKGSQVVGRNIATICEALETLLTDRMVPVEIVDEVATLYGVTIQAYVIAQPIAGEFWMIRIRKVVKQDAVKVADGKLAAGADATEGSNAPR